MKDKKHKYLEDLFDEYIDLHEEQLQIPMLIEKAQKKFDNHLSQDEENIYKYSEAEDLYRLFQSLKKFEDRRFEIREELSDLEVLIKGFLTVLNGGKISYDRKDEHEKSKVSYLFWLEGEQVKCNR